MEAALRFLRQFEISIYVLLGIGVLIYARRFSRAWQDVRSSLYGLERESAQQRINWSASVMVLLIMMGIAVFLLVVFVSPMMSVVGSIATPTIDPFSTLDAETLAQPEGEGLLEPNLNAPTPLPTVFIDESNCVPDQVMITSPEPGEEIRGEVEIRGTANIPNFGFYKFEISHRNQAIWFTQQANRKIIQDDVLIESWDTSLFEPGDYVIQLIVTDNEGNSLPPCRVPIKIAPPFNE